MDFSSDNRYAYYDAGLWLLTENNYSAFENRMDMILKMNAKEYQNQTKDYADYLMKYDPKIPTHIKIKLELQKHLSV